MPYSTQNWCQRPLLAILLFALALPGLAEPSDSAKLRQQLDAFLQGASTNDRASHDNFWADDLIYTSSSGQRFGKATLMAGLSAAPENSAVAVTHRYWAEDVTINMYGKTAVVAFRLMGETNDNGKVSRQAYYNTGTFAKRDGQWRAVAWQATKIPTSNPE